MVNIPKLNGMIKNVVDNQRVLRDMAKLSEGELLSDIKEIYAARYALQTAIEGCINIGNHVISSERYRSAENYADIFTVLNENELIGEQLCISLKKMARFRNRLVHLYWEIDDKMIYDILQNNINDIELFLISIERIK